MLRKSKIVKSELNDFANSKAIASQQSGGSFALHNKIKTDFSKNGPSYGDRFIPRRRLSRSDDTNKKFCTEKGNKKELLIWDLPGKYWLQNSIGELLDEAFNMKEKRILEFAATNHHNEGEDFKYEFTSNDMEEQDVNNSKLRTTGKDWICKARHKPYAYSESTHDSAGFSDCFERNMMDWSVNGQVVASFADDIIIWRTIRDTSITFRVENTSCLAYCPHGKYLAIGCIVATFPAIELWDISKYGVRVKVVWRYFFKSKALRLNCFEWSKCGKFLLAGTNKGIIYVLSVPRLKIIRKVESSKDAINTLRFSSTMRYLASADAVGNIIIYNWSNLKLSVHLHVFWRRKTKIMLDWHPWKGVYELAIAECKPASIVILNVPSKKITSFYRRRDRSIEIDTLAFNKITAELCISISKVNLDGYAESKILVLESLNRIVDVLTIEYGARFLMWQPDGTRLVTAGNDDSLTIWKYYPDIEKKCNRSNNANLLNADTKKKLFYGCDRGEEFRMWSNVR